MHGAQHVAWCTVRAQWVIISNKALGRHSQSREIKRPKGAQRTETGTEGTGPGNFRVVVGAELQMRAEKHLTDLDLSLKKGKATGGLSKRRASSCDD